MSDIGSPKRSTGVVIAASTLCALGLAGAVTGIIVAFASPAGASHATVTPSHHSSAPIAPVTPAAPATPHPTPVTPGTPASQMETIQRLLAQLNYYEGPIDGIMGPQTIQAITYLQRDAGLPQTGKLTQATYNALERMVVTGNNQMGGQ